MLDTSFNPRPLPERPKILATERDLDAVQDSLNHLWSPKLDFIFRDKSSIEKTLVVLFDDVEVFVWKREDKNYHLHRFPLTVDTQGFTHDWLAAGPVFCGLEKLLPPNWVKDAGFSPLISGALMTPFIEGQKNKKPGDSPYVTEESYKATIIHEFGHIHFDSTVKAPSLFEQVDLMKKAALIYEGQSEGSSSFALGIVSPRAISETFAFCTERAAAQMFWPDFKTALDSYMAKWQRVLAKEGQEKTPFWHISLLQSEHTAAATFGAHYMTRFKDVWPDALIRLGHATLGK